MYISIHDEGTSAERVIQRDPKELPASKKRGRGHSQARGVDGWYAGGYRGSF